MKNSIEDTKRMTFGNLQSDESMRNTIVAVVVDTSSNKFLCQFWKEYKGLTCLLSGGVEGDESTDEAVSREVLEETGYTDFTVVGRLGENIEMHYTKQNGEKFLKEITPYLVSLNSLDSVAHAREDDEKFENLFKSPDQIVPMMEVYESTTGSSLEDHKEILRRGIQYFTANN